MFSLLHTDVLIDDHIIVLMLNHQLIIPGLLLADELTSDTLLP